jgi:putative ABC transport system permease protein
MRCGDEVIFDFRFWKLEIANGHQAEGLGYDMANPMNWVAQVASVTRFGLQTIPQRRGASLTAAFGIAGVVAVLVGVLSIAEGFRRAMTAGGSPNTVLVLRHAADTEMMSILPGDEARIIADAPGVVRGAQGPQASAELVMMVNLPKRTTGTDANVPLRGVSPAAFDIRPKFRIIKGRRFESGRNEVIVGTGAAEAFAGLDLGAKVHLGSLDGEVVGIFETGGGVAESEIWMDAAILQSASERGNSYQVVYATLVSPESFSQFKDALTTDPRLKVKVERENDYYSDKSEAVSKIVRSLGTLVGVLMAVGAIFGALNTMYNAVATRTREIATLRALGFSGGPVVISILAESVLLALVGGVIGAALSYLAFDGYRTATLNWQTFSQVTFAFDVTPRLLIEGIVLAVVIGFIGGLFPAIRALRMPVAAALREL